MITVGCPRSGKTTLSHDLMDQGYVRLQLDDFRVALYGSKKRYWRLYEDDKAIAGRLQNVYMGALHSALERGQDNLVLSNTNLLPEQVDPIVEVLQVHTPILPTFVVFSSVSLTELLRRNRLSDGEGYVPEEYLGRCFEQLHAKDAWWRDVEARHPQMVVHK